MATTDELIRQLAADATKVPRAAAPMRLATGIALGAAASFVAIFVLLGPPLQSVEHTGAAALITKLLYSVTLLTMSFMLAVMAGRPGVEVRKGWLWLFVPPAMLAVGAAMELSLALPEQRQAIWLGTMWWMCLLQIVLLSLPIFAGIMWAFRRLAPTRLRLAGLLAGLAAGSAAASIYALYCPESTATFLLSWYSLGILTAGVFGAVVGPRLLRW